MNFTISRNMIIAEPFESSEYKKVVAVKESTHYHEDCPRDDRFENSVFTEAFDTRSIADVVGYHSELDDEEHLSTREISSDLCIATFYNRVHRKHWSLVLQLCTIDEFLTTPHKEFWVHEAGEYWPVRVYELYLG